MNNKFEALNAPKFRFLRTQITSLSLSLQIHPKKQDFDSKICKVHRDINAHDSWPLMIW